MTADHTGQTAHTKGDEMTSKCNSKTKDHSPTMNAEPHSSTKFYVTSWETGEILGVYEKLPQAQRYCKGRGHTGVDSPLCTGYPPIAYVANGRGECVYNPRFPKLIGGAARSVINSRGSDYF
jgi:hypothetical protein